MQFVVPVEHYDRFMGRYTPTLAVALADAAGVTSGQKVLDVGCGPGGLTRELGTRVGATDVAAVDPAPQFVAACRERNPGADVREGTAESLPWADAEFDATLSSLVIAFMNDPDKGVREMTRVTRGGGVVAACMWDIATGGMTMFRIFGTAMGEVAPHATMDQPLVGTAEDDIADRFRRAGLDDVVGGALTAHADYADFDDFWDPFLLGVGPTGPMLGSLTEEQRERVREASRRALPDGAFTLDARAWFARGTVPDGR